MGNQWTNTEELQEERFNNDPAVRERWDRTALARAVASAVIRYRAEHGLSQRDLAKRLGMAQPHIARLELGERNPSVDMLQGVAQGLGQCFVVAVASRAGGGASAAGWCSGAFGCSGSQWEQGNSGGQVIP